nr:uncharacterized protein LOC100185875 isoform X2 [Ciona intestinalis]|eukprot:XP_002121784.1 uncharacterized protein LOC100185875 isoform X2 [Ciona intestinalis]
MDEISCKSDEKKPVIKRPCGGGSESTTRITIRNSILKDSAVCSQGVTIGSHETMPSSKRSKKTPKSFTNIEKPTNEFIQTETYKKLEAASSKESIMLLHVHGYPGTGKSEAVRVLAQKFPGKNVKGNVVFKYHIECSNKDTIKKQFKEIIEAMKKHSYFEDTGLCTVAEKELEKNKSQAFVGLITDLGVAVDILIIIEDPPSEEFKLLGDFMRAVNSLDKRSTLFHVYITSRKNAVGLSHIELNILKQNVYHSYQLDGFTKAEGKLFLEQYVTDTCEEEQEAMGQLVQIVSGSPLGLLSIRAHCSTSRLTYQEHLERVNHSMTQTIAFDGETRHLKEEYGPHVSHLFESVITLLRPSSDKDVIRANIWKTIKVLCFFHHNSIPKYVIGRIAGIKRETELEPRSSFIENKADSGEVMTVLEDYGICRIGNHGDYTTSTIHFHEVIFRVVITALKIDNNEEYKGNLRQAIFVLSGVVNKDMRKSEDNIRMNKLSLHIDAVLGHSETQYSLEDLVSVVTQDFPMWMCLCHLMEVIGIIKSLGVLSLKKEAEQSLKSATKIVLKIISALTSTDIDSDVLQYSADAYPDEVATKLVSKTVEAGCLLSSRFRKDLLDEFMALVLQMKQSELEFLRKNSSEGSVITKVMEVYKNHLQIDLVLMAKLRNTESFLDVETHCKVFFAERLASILHTWGRVILYYNDTIGVELRKKHEWYSRLANCIAKECFKLTGVKLLFEHLSSVSIAPIMLKGLGGFADEERKNVLVKVRSILQELLADEESCMVKQQWCYEHGHIKETTGTVYNKMILLRFLVRVNCKLTALKTFDGGFRFASDADKAATDLSKISLENKTWIMAPKCLVYCGKYMASKGDFVAAVKLFSQALDIGIDQSNNLYAWACYNYARAVVAGRVTEHFSAALSKCSDVVEKQDDTDSELIEKIRPQLRILKDNID